MKRIVMLTALIVSVVSAREYHVSVTGSDQQDGSAATPLRTVSAAARLAQPGDIITVHEGTYREQVSPPRGGQSDTQRITYQAAAGEKVILKGSEPVKGWEKVQNDTWKVVIPNRFFDSFNPYSDLIRGDWFDPKGRSHHTGAVYLNGHWLVEAARLDEVLKPVADIVFHSQDYLLNIAWIQPDTASEGAKPIAAAGFSGQHGIQTAPCSEGGECIGWIEHNDWVQYPSFDFGQNCEQIRFRAASATQGGIIEIRLDNPEGTLLGSCAVANTGDWQAWTTVTAKIKPVSGTKTLCLVFKARPSEPLGAGLWFAQTNESNTTIWAQFKDLNPNQADVEINVRKAVFYPDKPGVNYITVKGFTMMHAATNWAPPTAEQVGLLGTHWSKGWIIENNDIRYSTCVGVSLGKHGDRYDNTSANTAEGYVKTIERAAQDHGWSKDTIGHHIVRNNHIAHCEQAGVVGSLGAIFSTITQNDIHDIHIRQLFGGAEMAGIKLHAAIDTEISRNHIYRTTLGIWLDWMNQGSRVTGNLLHDNGPSPDLFVEVNHGPFVVDNNLFLSHFSLLNISEGGAYIHNLFAGRITMGPELNRETPYHKAHSTEVAGLVHIKGGDDRFYSNIFVGHEGLAYCNNTAYPTHLAGNVFLKGARPSTRESNPIVLTDADPAIHLVEDKDGIQLNMTFDKRWAGTASAPLVTSELLGKAKIPDLPYRLPDGSAFKINTDYRGLQRPAAGPTPGPFEQPGSGKQTLKVWPNR
ncbi:MAG TPA: carbohydrate-binding protein [Anaerohalosphaeraceae bacterium]|nr:carbohydrate-binding protein [Anaerohalosphaeraceae bacterium]